MEESMQLLKKTSLGIGGTLNISLKQGQMDPFKSAPIREKFRTIHYIFYVEYERLEFLLNYPTTLLDMEFVNKEESKKTQSIQVMDLDELEKRLSKGYRFYKKIRTTLNLKEEWDFVKLKILFMRQYSQLFVDGFEPERGYFYLEKASDLVEKRKKINRNPYDDDVNFYRYLVEIDRTNFFILTNQYRQLLSQCEVYIDCASKLEEYRRKPFNILVPFRIYVGCGMIYEFFNQENDIIVNTFLRGVQIIEKNIDDVGRYFLQNDLLIYVQAYVKIVKCKIRLKDYENAEQWARSTLKFIQDNTYLLRLEPDSKVVKKIQNLHQQAITEIVARNALKLETQKQQQLQLQKLENKKLLTDENMSPSKRHASVSSSQRRSIDDDPNSHQNDQMLDNDKSQDLDDSSFQSNQVDNTQNATTNNQNETQQQTQSLDPNNSRLDTTHINHYQQFYEAINKQKRLDEISRRLVGVQNIQSHFKPISQIKQEITGNNEQIDLGTTSKAQQLNKEFYNYPASLLSPAMDQQPNKEKDASNKDKDKEITNLNDINLASPKKDTVHSSDEGDEDEEEYSLGDSDDDEQQLISFHLDKKKDKKNKHNNNNKHATNNNTKKESNTDNAAANASETPKMAAQTSPINNTGMFKSGRFSASQPQLNKEIEDIPENGEEEDSPMITRIKGVVGSEKSKRHPLTPVSLRNIYDTPRLSFNDAANQVISEIQSADLFEHQQKLNKKGKNNEDNYNIEDQGIYGNVGLTAENMQKSIKNAISADKDVISPSTPMNNNNNLLLLKITSMKQIPEAFEDDSPRKKTQDQMNHSHINVHKPEIINEKPKPLQTEEEFYFSKAVSKQEINLPENKNQDSGQLSDKLIPSQSSLGNRELLRIQVQDTGIGSEQSISASGSNSKQINNNQNTMNQLGLFPAAVFQSLKKNNPDSHRFSIESSDMLLSHFGPQSRKVSSGNFQQNSFDQTIGTVNSCQSIGLPANFNENNNSNSNNSLNAITPSTGKQAQHLGGALPRKSIFSDQKTEFMGLNGKTPKGSTLNGNNTNNNNNNNYDSDDSSITSKPSNEDDSKLYHSPRRRQSLKNEGKEQLFKKFMCSTETRVKQKGNWKGLQLNTYLKGQSTLQCSPTPLCSLLSQKLIQSPGQSGTNNNSNSKQLQLFNGTATTTANKGNINSNSDNQADSHSKNILSNGSSNKLELRQKLIQQLKSHHAAAAAAQQIPTSSAPYAFSDKPSTSMKHFLLWKSDPTKEPTVSTTSTTNRQNPPSHSSSSLHEKNIFQLLQSDRIQNDKLVVKTVNSPNKNTQNYFTKRFSVHQITQDFHNHPFMFTQASSKHRRTLTQAASTESFNNKASPVKIFQEEQGLVYPVKPKEHIQISPFKDGQKQRKLSATKITTINNTQYLSNSQNPKQHSNSSLRLPTQSLQYSITAEERHCLHNFIERKINLEKQKNNSKTQENSNISIFSYPNSTSNSGSKTQTGNILINEQQVILPLTPKKKDKSMDKFKLNILISPPPPSNSGNSPGKSAAHPMSPGIRLVVSNTTIPTADINNNKNNSNTLQVFHPSSQQQISSVSLQQPRRRKSIFVEKSSKVNAESVPQNTQ